MILNKEMAQATENSFYAVEFDKRRVMRPKSVKFTLGRLETSDFVIPSPKVSDKHCEIACLDDAWMLRNLSPDGTSLVGKAVARNEPVILGNDTLLKIGGMYIQCKTEVESAQSCLQILKICILMGDKICYLSAHYDNQPEEPIETDTPESTDNSRTEIPIENSIPHRMTGEINNFIDDMASENLHIALQLQETKEALRKALLEKGDVECVVAELQDQLTVCRREMTNRDEIRDILESELQCTICNEFLIDAVTLDCSHTYCEYCLQQWKRTLTICPLCRKNIVYECKTRVIDSFIDRVIFNFPNDALKRRKELAESRKGQNN